jgi:hypothetical protein
MSSSNSPPAKHTCAAMKARGIPACDYNTTPLAEETLTLNQDTIMQIMHKSMPIEIVESSLSLLFEGPSEMIPQSDKDTPSASGN